MLNHSHLFGLVLLSVIGCTTPPAIAPRTRTDFALREPIEIMAASTDGEQVLIAGHGTTGTNVLHLYSRAAAKTMPSRILKARVIALDLLDTSGLVALDDGSVLVVQLPTGEDRELQPAGSATPTALVAIDSHRFALAMASWPPSPRGATILIQDDKGTTQREVCAQPPVAQWLDLAYANGQLFGLAENRIWQCQLDSNQSMEPLASCPTGDPSTFTVTPDRTFLVGGLDVRLRNNGEDQLLADVLPNRVRQLAITNDANTVAWIDGALTLQTRRRSVDGRWNAVPWNADTSGVQALAIDPLGRYLALGMATGGLVVLEIPVAPVAPQR